MQIPTRRQRPRQPIVSLLVSTTQMSQTRELQTRRVRQQLL